MTIQVSVSELGPAADAGRIARYFLIGLPILYGLLSLWMGQDANWDLENYHWYNPYALLNGRQAQDLLVAQTPTFYNPLLDVPFYLAASHLPARLVGFLLGCVQGLNFVLLYHLAHAVIRRPPVERMLLAGAAALLGMVGGGVLGEIGTTFWDTIISLGLLGGMLILIPYTTDTSRKLIWAIVAGLLLGASAGFKQPQLLYCGGIGLASLTLPGPWPRRIALAACLGIGMIAGAALSAGWWMAHMAQEYGNPLFPYFNNVFRGPLADPTYSFRDNHLVPTSLKGFLLFPFAFTLDPILVGEVVQRGTAILALYILAPIAAVTFLARRYSKSLVAGSPVEPLLNWGPTRFILATIVFSYLAWLKMFSIYRYAIPLEMLSPVGLIIAISAFPLAPRRLIGAVLAIFAVCAVTTLPANWGRVAWHDRYIEVQLPPQKPGTMVLMAGYAPLGFLAPSFPHELPVVRIQSNFMPPFTPPTQFTDIAKARVAAHTGPFVIVFWPFERPNIDHATADFGLAVVDSSCVNVPNSLEDGKIQMCDAVRKAP